MTPSIGHRPRPFRQALLALQVGLLLHWPFEAQAAKAACSFAAEGGDQVRMSFNRSRAGRRVSDDIPKSMHDNELWKELGEVVVVKYNLETSDKELDVKIQENRNSQNSMLERIKNRTDAILATQLLKNGVDEELREVNDGIQKMTAGLSKATATGQSRTSSDVLSAGGGHYRFQLGNRQGGGA